MNSEKMKEIDNVIFDLISDLKCTKEKIEETLDPYFEQWNSVEATYSYVSLNDYYKELKNSSADIEEKELIEVLDKYYSNIFLIGDYYRNKKRKEKINKFML